MSGSLASKPVSEAADEIVAIAGEELAKRRKDDDFKSLEGRINELYTICRNARRMDEIQWYKNIDMYQGRQFTIWDDVQKRMVQPPALPHTPRIAINFIEPTVRTEMAKINGMNPMATVAAASNDMEDVLAAEAGEAVYDFVMAAEEVKTRAFPEANFWRTITGQGFIKTYYDTSCVDPAAKAAAGRMQNEQNRQLAQQAQLAKMPMGAFSPAPSIDVKPGKIAIDPVTPFNLLVPDMEETELQRQPYVIHAYTRPLEQAQMLYKDSLPDGEIMPTTSASELINLTHLGIRGGNPAKPDSVLIFEVWVKPNFLKELPDGGLVIAAGNRIVALYDQGIPYAHGEYPFAPLWGIPSGRFYRKSVVQTLIPLQDEVNLTYSQIIKRKNIASNPGFFYYQGSLDPKRITNKPGLYVPVQLGMSMPQPIPVTEAPAYVQNLIDRILAHKDDISGQHQVSRAIAPGADTAASAIGLLREADDDFQAPALLSVESAMQRIGRQALALAVQYWDQDRLVQVVGADGSFDAKLLKGADIASGTDLRVEAGTGMPTSKTARIATISDWIEKGFIPADVGLEAMEMGTLGRLFDRLKVDRAQAQRENVEMRELDPLEAQQFFMQQQAAAQQFQQQAANTGTDPAMIQQAMAQAPQPGLYPIGWMDNDEVHIQVHKDYAKSQAFASLDPAIQQVFEQHVRDHEQRLIQAQQADAERQAQAIQEQEVYKEAYKLQDKAIQGVLTEQGTPVVSPYPAGKSGGQQQPAA